MKRTHIGEFEEIVMLTVGILYDEAYGLAVTKEVNRQTNRQISLSAVHSALLRLEQKGFLISRLADATNERGGKRKRYFTITAEGKHALREVMDLRVRLWQAIPQVALQ